MGTGSAVIHFKDQRSQHVGGTGVGGGTIIGLASLICGITDPLVIDELAAKGNAANINLTISDLGYNSISFLSAEMTASNFANLKSDTVEDRAAGIFALVAETVGIIASICAREYGCSDRIVMIGKVAQSKTIRHILRRVGELYQSSFIFPETPGFATVYGAERKYIFDRERKKQKEA
jgi:type II pantothenate kinase